jgi:hypothetical protein
VHVLQQAEYNHPPALSTPDAHLHPPPLFSSASTPQNKHTTSSVTAITDDDSDARDDQLKRHMSFSSPNFPISLLSFLQSKRGMLRCHHRSQVSRTRVWFSRYLSTCTNHHSNVITGKTKHATLDNPVAIDADGLLMDVDVQLVNDNPSSCEDKHQDVDHFFCPAVVKNVNRKSKKYCACKSCL